MLEAYTVGAKLELTSNAGAVLDKLMADFEKFNVLVKETGAAIARLGRGLKSDGAAVAGLDRMAQALETAEKAGSGLGAALRRNAEYATETAKAMEASARAMETAGRAQRSANSSSGGSHGGGRFSEHSLTMAGMGAGIVGGALLDAVRHTMTPAIDVNRTRDVLAADMRLSPEQVDASMARAREVTKLAPGTTIGENLASTLDLKTIFGSLDEAEKLLPEFARMTALFRALDRKGGGSGDQAFAAGKALEVMAGMVTETTDAQGHTVRTIDPELGMKRLQEMQRVAVATNMRVLPSDYLGLAKQARVAGMTLTDEFTYEKLPGLMAVLGGSRTGTALMSMAQVFEGGKLTKESMEALQSIGLAGRGGITRERGRNGKMHDVVHPEAIYDLDVMMHDPQKYIEAAQKRMEAAGIHGTEAQITALMRASQRSTIAGIFADLLKDMPAILKEQQNIINTRSDMAEHMAEVDPAAKVQQFEAALTNLATELGSAGMGDAMKVLGAVTAGLNALGDWAHNNPQLARIAFDVGAGLGAVAVGLSAVSTALLVFGPALKLLGFGGGGAAAGAGAAGGAGGFLSRLGPIGALLGTLLGIAAVGSNAETPENRKRLEDLNRARRGGNGIDAFGSPTATPESYIRPLPQPPIENIITINLDGEVLHRSVMKRMARDAIRPPGNGGHVDSRMSLIYPT